MTKQTSDMIQLNKQLDAIVSSDGALNSALHSHDPVLRTAARLTNNTHPKLSPIARQTMRANVANTSSASSNIIAGNFTAWVGRIAAIFVISIMLGLAAQPVSANSLPGDALYPVKLGFEQLELTFAGSPTDRAQVHLKHAEQRLHEVQLLRPNSEFVTETLQSALTSLNVSATIASENAIFERNSAFTEQTESTINNLEQALAASSISSDTVMTFQLSLSNIRAELPVAIVEQPDDASAMSQAEPDFTPEVTEANLASEGIPEIENNSASSLGAPEAVSAEQTTRYIYSEGRVNVRSGAGISFDIVGIATQNTPVTVINQTVAGDWIEVRLPNGTQGWIFNELLDTTPGQSSGAGYADSNFNTSNNGNGNANGNGNPNANNNGNANGNASNSNRDSNANNNSNTGNANGNSNGN